MEQNFEHSEIICVNDFSSDNSVKVIESCCQESKDTSISVVNMSYFHGVEYAMNAGVDLAIGDFVFEFDNTNLDFDDDVIMQVYRHSLEGYDIVSAAPEQKERFTSNLFYKVFARYSSLNYKMTSESFRVLSRRVINRITSMNKTIPYRKALYVSCGLKTDVIKYSVKETQYKTHDKLESHYRSELAIDSLLLFTDVGYRASMIITLIMMCLSIFVSIYSIVTYFCSDPVSGWTTTIVFLSIAFFALFGILTIIIKYLQLLLDMTFKRKHYSFESIVKLTK